MQNIKLLMEDDLHLSLIAYPFRLYTFSEWAGSSMFNFSFMMFLRLCLWFPKVFLEKMNKKKLELDIQWWPKALLFQILAFPLLYMFFYSFDKNCNIWSFTQFQTYTLNGIIGFLSGAFFHFLYEVLKLFGDQLRNDFNCKGIGHLIYLIIQIPFVCILEGMIEKSATNFESLSISFLSILTYLIAYAIENKNEFQYAWDIFGNKKFIGG